MLRHPELLLIIRRGACLSYREPIDQTVIFRVGLLRGELSVRQPIEH